MPKRLKVKWQSNPAIVINRTAFRDKKLVYVGRTNKRIRYPWGSSLIAYIGTTKKGAKRIASSAAIKGEKLLYEYGIKHVEFNVVTCGKVQGVETWRKLERALLLRFKEQYGLIPRANNAGKKTHWKDERKYFTIDRLDRILDEMG
jgi:hypothetical protein